MKKKKKISKYQNGVKRMSNITRRNFLNITAISLALPFCASSLFANTQEKITWKGFALGAVIAAEWIIGKKGVFTMKDVLELDK